jgi:hypothetical protein
MTLVQVLDSEGGKKDDYQEEGILTPSQPESRWMGGVDASGDVPCASLPNLYCPSLLPGGRKSSNTSSMSSSLALFTSTTSPMCRSLGDEGQTLEFFGGTGFHFNAS